MRIAYLDCFSGISGDMFLGALVDAGVPILLLEETVAALSVGARLEISQVVRSGLSARKVDVIVAGEKDLPREVFQAQNVVAHYHHDPAPPELAAQRPHSHSRRHAHRPLRDILDLISHLRISETARARASAIFRALGEAEARIHQVDVDQVEFHEVGAADALVDIVCAAVGSEALNIDEWICSPLNVGGGTVQCAHGTLPVPAPATLELLKARHAPMYSSGIEKELVTPTGAAIVSVLAIRFGAFPPMTVGTTAYGAGYRDLPGHPNVLRLTIGESLVYHPERSEAPCFDSLDRVTVIEANLDDLTPQVFAYVLDRALAAGAFDVFATPVQMKKGRPGLLLTVLCRPVDAHRLAQLLFAETTTLGVRMREDKRLCLSRRFVTVSTTWGDVRIKVGSLNGTVTNFAPEYEDCRRIAAEQGVPLKTVMQESVRLYLERHHE